MILRRWRNGKRSQTQMVLSWLNPGRRTKGDNMLILALLLHWGFIAMMAIGWIILAISIDDE